MKIGIIIHSYTGHTLSVAQKLKEKLTVEGHLVSIKQVMAVNEDPSAVGNIKLKTIPDVDAYEVIIFGAPVRAFSISPVMKAYLSQLSSIKGKKIGCFVTQYFPYPWMGGNNAINQIKKICEAKGENIFESSIVNWSNKRERKITDLVEKLTKL